MKVKLPPCFIIEKAFIQKQQNLVQIEYHEV